MSLFVGNLSSRIKSEDLEKIFFEFGKCKVDKMQNFAFIDYLNENDAKEAIKNLNKNKVRGLVINIEWSKKSKNYKKRSNSRDFVSYINYNNNYEYDYALNLKDEKKYKLIPCDKNY